MVHPRRQRAIRTNFLTAASVNIGAAGLGFVASVIVTRALGPDGRGKFSFVLNALGLLIMVAGSGGLFAVTRSSARVDKNPKHLYRPAALVGLVTSSLAVIVFLIAWWALAGSLFSGVGAGSLVWVPIVAPPTLILSYLSFVAALDDQVVEFAVATLISTLIYLVATAVLATSHDLNLRTIIPAWSICSLLPAAVVWSALKERAGPNGRQVFRQMIRFAAIGNVGDLAMLLVLRADVLVVKARRGFFELGQYAVAVGMAEIVLQAGVGLRFALIPLQGASDQHDRGSLRRGLAQTIRVGLILGIVSFVAALVLSRPLLELAFGNRFLAAAPAVAWLVPGVVAQSLQGPIRDFLLVEGKARGPNAAAVLMLAVNVGLNIVLLRDHTFVASALLSTLAYSGNFLACLLGFLKLTGIPWRDVLIPKAEDAALLRRLVRWGGTET